MLCRGGFGTIPYHTEYIMYRIKSFGTPNLLPLPYQNFQYTEFGIPKNWYGKVRYGILPKIKFPLHIF